MKNWLTKFRISSALDAGKPLSESLRRKIQQSDRLRQFVAETIALENSLKNHVPKPPSPPSLHSVIMNSIVGADVRRLTSIKPTAASQPPLRSRYPNRGSLRHNPLPNQFLRWLPAPALALLLVASFWWALHRPISASSGSLSMATTTLQLGGDMPQTIPAAVVAPLSQELDHLNRDLDSAARFVLASLP